MININKMSGTFFRNSIPSFIRIGGVFFQKLDVGFKEYHKFEGKSILIKQY